MQNRYEKKDENSGFFYAGSGALIGSHYWNEFYHIPYKREMEYQQWQLRTNRFYSFHYLQKVSAARVQMISGLRIIPISALALYLVGKSFTFFGKSKSKDEIYKIEVKKLINDLRDTNKY